MLQATVLGSGASLPTLHRHTTSVAVQREGDLYLIDCGEGTQLQWRRAGLRFAKLRAICVSHLHGDHINGLVGLLQTLALSGREQRLQLFGPPGLSGYLGAARKHLGLRLTYELDVQERSDGLVLEGNGHRILCAPLDHGIATLGYSVDEDERPGRFDLDAAAALEIPEGPLYGRLQRGETVELADGRQVRPDQVLGPARPGSKLTYCVDTRPCDAAVELARGSDLFICDSTFTDELTLEARRRGHCTARQAAEMARDAEVQRLLLIHISARYHDPRALLDEATEIFADCEVAADLRELRI